MAQSGYGDKTFSVGLVAMSQAYFNWRIDCAEPKNEVLTFQLRAIARITTGIALSAFVLLAQNPGQTTQDDYTIRPLR